MTDEARAKRWPDMEPANRPAEQSDGSGVRCRPRTGGPGVPPTADPRSDTVVEALPWGASAEAGEACGPSPAGAPEPPAVDRSPLGDAPAELGRGRWRLLRTLGVGGMAAVFEAVDVRTRKHVAVKLLHDARGARDDEVRFRREAHLASTIHHPNVVRVLASGRCRDGRLYQVQEMLEGEDLGTVMERGRIGSGLAVCLGVQVLSALAEVHRHDFVHRDVKPANVFLARERSGATRVKLLDLGIAKHMRPEDGLRSLTVAGATMGTPHYMSPEQALARPVTARSDIWSVGVVLYHALTGEPPFDAEQLHDLLLRIANNPAPSLGDARPDLPAHLVDAVDRALENDPARRWPSAEYMAAALVNA